MRTFLTLHSPRNARDYYAAGLWQDETFYSLLVRHANARGDAPCVRDGSRSLSWRQLWLWVDALAEMLGGLGLVPGDRVSIWMGNRIEAVLTFLACARNGYACNPSLHRTYTSAEIRGLLECLSSRVVLTAREWGSDGATADLDAVLSGLPDLQRILRPDQLPAAFSRPSVLPIWDDPDSVRYLAFTSGTTGTPKCVMHSDNTLLANARDMVRDWDHGPGTVLLTLSPLSHHIAWVAVAEWLLAGCTLVLDDPPQGLSRLDWLLETGATYVMGVPTHTIDILAEQKRRGIERLGNVSVFYMAGAPIPPSVCEAFVSQGVTPQNVYGMTENSSHQYTHPHDDPAVILRTCGRGGPAYRVRIFDPANPDSEVPAGTVGEIGGKGAALMLGYFGGQEVTEKSFNRDGWFMSGDLGSLDADGNLTIQGRLKDLIIRGGHNIYPTHIEALALRHPSVNKAAAFPVADERLGEKLCIAVIGDIEAGALLAHLDREGLSKYDMPEYFIRLENFPLTASGKILKRELVAMAQRAEIEPGPVRFAASDAKMADRT